MYIDAMDDLHRDFIRKVMDDKTDESIRQTLPNKLVNDPRVTPVGQFIRHMSIDELPQLWNVLKGDMSIVGPRPTIPYELEHFDEQMYERFNVNPGLTGLWQVSGRSMLGYRDMVKLDIEYVRTWSLALDLKIMAKTLIIVFISNWAH
jgi:lipopolysaccharide/colanic/teichoic acid biosynthesis glycosyltransferase